MILPPKHKQFFIELRSLLKRYRCAIQTNDKTSLVNLHFEDNHCCEAYQMVTMNREHMWVQDRENGTIDILLKK